MASPTRRKNINGSNSPNYNRNDSFDSTTFTSAIRRNDTANAFNRKIRTASAGQGSITPVGGWIKQPFQSDLDDQPYPSNSTQDSEPLSSHPLSSSSSTHDLNHDHRSTSRSVTRKRRSSDDSWSGDIFAETVRGKRKEEDDREVIVHEVLSTDSLAGVALKYGVELAVLRKANKLWSSDPIHLRKFLYIPVDSQKWEHGRNINKDLLEGSDETDQESRASSSDRGSSPQHSRNASSSRPNGISATPTIRRIPASEFAFFPPPSASPSKPRQTAPTTGADIPPPLFFSSLPRSGSNSIRRPSFSRGLSSNEALSISAFPLLQPISRNIPSLFSVFPSNPPSRVSFSSEADTEISDDVDVELDNADTWKKQPTHHRSNRTRSRPPISASQSATQLGTPSGGTKGPSNPTVKRIIRNQQPSPSPQMELPVRNGDPFL